MGFDEKAGVCESRPWFLQKDDVVSFGVCQRHGAVVGRSDLTDVSLKDPQRLSVVLSCLRVSIPGHEGG